MAVHTTQSLAIAVFVAVVSVTGVARATVRRAPPATAVVRTVTERIPSSSPAYTATLSVPQLIWPGRRPVVDRVNATIIRWVEAQVRGFAATVRARASGPSSLPQSSLAISYQVTRMDAAVLSIRFTSDAYVRGQAAPSQTPAGLTFSLASGKAYSLSSLFRPGAPYLRDLARLITQGLKAYHPAGARCYVGGRGPSAQRASFGAWWLNPGALVVAYPAGEYTAAYCGPPTVTITAARLVPLLAAGSPLAPV